MKNNGINFVNNDKVEYLYVFDYDTTILTRKYDVVGGERLNVRYYTEDEIKFKLPYMLSDYLKNNISMYSEKSLFEKKLFEKYGSDKKFIYTMNFMVYCVVGRSKELIYKSGLFENQYL